MKSSSTTPAARFWLPSKEDYPKYLPIFLMKGVASFVFILLGLLKEPLLCYADGSRMEIIPVVKLCGVLPSAFFFILLYGYLTAYLSPKRLFYGTCWIFVVFLSLYITVLYPYLAFVTPVSYAKEMTVRYPLFADLFLVLRYWPHVLFFIMAELWGQISIFVLFWGTVNEVCTVEESKRAYPLFILGGGLGGFSGAITTILLNKAPLSSTGDLLRYRLFIGLAITMILGMMGLYAWLQANMPKESTLKYATVHRKASKGAPLSFVESVKIIVSNPYLLVISMTVICCSMSLDLAHLTWKANAKTLYDARTYHSFLGYKKAIVLALSSLISFCLSSYNVIHRFGWRKSALVPPVVMMCTGTLFFFLSKYSHHLADLAHSLGTDPLTFVVFFGAFQSISSKVTKYTFFDVCKEIVYIPLPLDMKRKGKGAVDVLSSRMGKASSSLIQMMLRYLTGEDSILAITAYIMPIFLFVGAAWSYALHYLDKEFKHKVATQKQAS